MFFRRPWTEGSPAEKTKKPNEDSKMKPLISSRSSLVEKTVLLCFLLFLTLALGESVHLIDQPGNIWVTWANRTNQTDFCLSLQSATSPFQTCLVGIPVWDDTTGFQGYVKEFNDSMRQDPCRIWCLSWRQNGTEPDRGNDTVIHVSKKMACIICRLNVTLPWDPQELQLLGSQRVPNETWDAKVRAWWSPGCLGFAKFNNNGSLSSNLDLFTPRGPYWNARENRSEMFTLVNSQNTEQFAWHGPYCGFYANISTLMLNESFLQTSWGLGITKRDL